MKAIEDRAYCTNKECKNRCWRHEDNWEFEEGIWYTFIAGCPDEKC